MPTRIGIRRENKNKWERRVPIIPAHVRRLVSQYDIQFIVQPSENRIFESSQYRQAGAEISEDLSPCDIIMGVKEVPVDLLQADKVYLYFSHTLKGQAYNMPMLQRLLDLKCTLIDYEGVKDADGRRLVFFGRFAGLAGMIDTLYTLGRRLQAFSIETPFNAVRQAYAYSSLDEAKAHIREIGDDIRKNGLPQELTPFVVGFTGYGNVSQGAQEIFDLLPVREIRPQELASLPKGDGRVLYKVVFYEQDIVEPKSGAASFEATEYFQSPERFRPVFDRWLPHLTVLLNGIYWEERYPRLVTKKFLREHFDSLRLRVIGDISCDINGSIEMTEKVTEPDAPFFVYDAKAGGIVDDSAPGIAVMAIDNLPAEFAAEASASFSEALMPFMGAIAGADYSLSFEQCTLPPEIKNAVIVYNGELTCKYEYLQNYLK